MCARRHEPSARSRAKSPATKRANLCRLRRSGAASTRWRCCTPAATVEGYCRCFPRWGKPIGVCGGTISRTWPNMLPQTAASALRVPVRPAHESGFRRAEDAGRTADFDRTRKCLAPGVLSGVQPSTERVAKACTAAGRVSGCSPRGVRVRRTCGRRDGWRLYAVWPERVHGRDVGLDGGDLPARAHSRAWSRGDARSVPP